MRASIAPRLKVPIILLAIAMAAPVLGQQVGRNVNMVNGLTLPTGDPYLQRQNEPSIAVSSRNPTHLLAGANDYRTVDVPFVVETPEGEEPVGDAWLSVFKSTDSGESWNSTLLPGYPQDVSPEGTSSPLWGYDAAADPVVRAGANGIFYYTGIVFDRDPVSGVRGRSAVFVARFIDDNNTENGDPFQLLDINIVASSGGNVFLDKPWMIVDVPTANAPSATFPVGDGSGDELSEKVQVCHVAGPKKKKSKGAGDRDRRMTLTISRGDLRPHLDHGDEAGPCALDDDDSSHDDSSDDDGGGPGNSGTPGESQQVVQCGAAILVYTEFRAGFEANALESRLVIRRSADCGSTWRDEGQLNAPGTIAQGGALAIDPSNGDVWVAWRQFAGADGTSSNAIFAARSGRGGTSFGAPRLVANIDPFEQGSSNVSFRTNAFPSLAVANGTAYIVWAQRDLGPDGSARIVLSTSADAMNWSTPLPIDPALTQAGHQFMPAIAVAGGRIMVLYYDQRLDLFITLYNWLASAFPQFATLTEFIFDPFQPTAPRHTLDVRVAEATIDGFGQPGPFNPSILVSRYLHTLTPTDPAPVQSRFNPPNYPLFGRGSLPNIGDYIDIAASPTIVPDGSGGWRFNDGSPLAGGEAPTTVFHAVWTDNRNVKPPPDIDGDGNPDWDKYTPANSLQPPEFVSPTTCTVPDLTGTRNQDIYTARIAPGGLYFIAPGNAKPLGEIQRAFVVFAQNTTYAVRRYQLTILNPNLGVTASFEQFDETIDELEVLIAPQSSISRTVYVESATASGMVEVVIQELQYDPTQPLSGQPALPAQDGAVGSVLLNADPTNPNIINPNIVNPNIVNPNIINAEVYNPNIVNPNIVSIDLSNPNIVNPNIVNPNIINPNIVNPNIINPNIINPNIINPNIVNPNIINPNIINPNIVNPNIVNPNIVNPNIVNPNIINGAIIDVSWEVQNVGNTTSAYSFDLVTGEEESSSVVLQLLVYQVHQKTTAIGCDLVTDTEHELIVNITPRILNIRTDDLDLSNPNIINAALLDNASFYLEPGATALVTLRIVDLDTGDGDEIDPGTIAGAVTPQAIDTEDIIVDPGTGDPAPPPDVVPTVAALAIVTGTLPPAIIDVPYSEQLEVFGGIAPHVWSLVDGTLPAGVMLGSDGLLNGTPTETGDFGFTAQAIDSTIPTALLDTQPLTLKVNSALPDPVKAFTGSDTESFESFGRDVDVDGDVLVVGAYEHEGTEGAAYVFERTAGVWNQTAKLTANPGTADDRFGDEVAVSGNTLVVGGPQRQCGGPGDCPTGEEIGAVHVFEKDDGIWIEVAVLQPPDVEGEAGEQFGAGLDIDGDVLAIGAWNGGAVRGGNGIEGVVYVYERIDGEWELIDRLHPDNPANFNQRFGDAIAVDGQRIVVGSQDIDEAYSFVRIGDSWTREQKLLPFDPITLDPLESCPGCVFGAAIAVSGDTLVVGDRGADGERGYAYVYNYSGGAWVPQTRLEGISPAPGDQFGASVVLSGDTIVVGVENDDTAGPDAGAAVVFTRSGGTWDAGHQFLSSNAPGSARFGASAAMQGDTLVVGSVRGTLPAGDFETGTAEAFDMTDFSTVAGASPAGSAGLFRVTTLTLPDGVVDDPQPWLGAGGGDGDSPTVEFASSTNEVSFSYFGDLPPGLDLDESSGEVTGVPTTAGEFAFTVIADDSDEAGEGLPLSEGDSQFYLLTIDPAPVPTYTVSGTVQYSSTLLDGHQVDLIEDDVLNPPTQTTTTADGGEYSFSGVPDGDYHVKVTGGGEFIAWTALSTSVSGANVIVSIDLPKTIALIAPANGSTVNTLTPTLTWTANPQATKYVVQINRTSDFQLHAQADAFPASYTVSTPLDDATGYTWQVDAYDAQQHHVGTTQFAFTLTAPQGVSITAATPNPMAPGFGQLLTLTIENGPGLNRPAGDTVFARNDVTGVVSSNNFIFGGGTFRVDGALRPPSGTTQQGTVWFVYAASGERSNDFSVTFRATPAAPVITKLSYASACFDFSGAEINLGTDSVGAGDWVRIDALGLDSNTSQVNIFTIQEATGTGSSAGLCPSTTGSNYWVQIPASVDSNPFTLQIRAVNSTGVGDWATINLNE